ncbi:MAG: DUF1127 domain-containing protein [Geminicoccaceae bacterium]
MIAVTRHLPTRLERPSLGSLFGALERWSERRRQRRALLQLDDKLLKDIGLSYADAWQEGSKPFWRR